MKYSLIFLLALTILAGCGGGSSTGGSYATATTGTVSGTLSLATASSSSSKINISRSPLPSFPKAPLQKAAMSRASVSNEKIVKFHANLSEEAIRQLVHSYGGLLKRKLYGTDNTYVIQDESESLNQSGFAKDSNIEYVETSQIYHALDASVTPNDPDYATQQTWNYGLLNLPKAWKIQKGNGTGIIVAVIDTGVSLDHPDIAANLVSGYDFVDNDSTPSDNQFMNNNNRYSHGTHVAGIISAVTNNNLGVAGVAWNVKIMPVRVLGNDGSGSDYVISSGIRWAVQHGADIINLSMGAAETAAAASQTFKNALQYALNHNVTVVAAAGNERHDVDFPANYPGVIAVSAVDSHGIIASYSNYGSEVWVCAPGGDDSSSYVFSTTYDKSLSANNNIYAGMAGTSMACPHIAGLAALLYARGITSPTEIRERLKNGSASRTNQYGYGLPDAYQILGRAAAKVFYALADGTTGNMTTPGAGGVFTISNIPIGQVYACGFIDIDGDARVSSGDMFARAPVNSAAGTTVTQDLTLSPVSITTPKSLSSFIIDGFQ